MTLAVSGIGSTNNSSTPARRGSCSIIAFDEAPAQGTQTNSAQAVRRKSLVLRMDKEVNDSDEALQCDR